MFDPSRRVAAIVMSLALVACVSGYDTRGATSMTAVSSAPIATSPVTVEDMSPQPPFDERPITPVESAGAAREQ